MRYTYIYFIPVRRMIQKQRDAQYTGRPDGEPWNCSHHNMIKLYEAPHSIQIEVTKYFFTDKLYVRACYN